MRVPAPRFQQLLMHVHLHVFPRQHQLVHLDDDAKTLHDLGPDRYQRFRYHQDDLLQVFVEALCKGPLAGKVLLNQIRVAIVDVGLDSTADRGQIWDR